MCNTSDLHFKPNGFLTCTPVVPFTDPWAYQSTLSSTCRSKGPRNQRYLEREKVHQRFGLCTQASCYFPGNDSSQRDSLPSCSLCTFTPPLGRTDFLYTLRRVTKMQGDWRKIDSWIIWNGSSYRGWIWSGRLISFTHNTSKVVFWTLMKIYFLTHHEDIRILLASFCEQLHRWSTRHYPNDLPQLIISPNTVILGKSSKNKSFPYPTFRDDKAFKKNSKVSFN